MIVETWIDPAKIQMGDTLSLGGVGLVVLEVYHDHKAETVWIELARPGVEDPFCEIYFELDSRVLVRRETA